MSGQKNQRSKYFLGIVIPSPILEKIEQIKLELYHDYGLKGALRSPAHITLHRPFEWPADTENRMIESLEKFNQPATFDIELCDFGFFDHRVIYIDVKPNKNLFSLHDALGQYAKTNLRLFNETDDLRGFHPHVTVAFRDLKRRHFDQLKPSFATRKFKEDFSFSGFSLLKLDKVWKEHHSFTC